ncbi:MAG: tRNA (adenosine(37)-N6)-threonylcarbamoyltransferase complex dimerization subunit type 1 TsaB [Clostridia bacterium]|nr:tRNA (adenosine(37)-N6)-threonylcarbamoyltransferase complex dimerization subunit type 1 TsaB [Clostridia bacterium]
MRILAIETTDRVASVALLTRDGVYERIIDSGLRHAQTLMTAVDELLKQSGTCLEQVDAFAVDVGPGSFTGVRIGVTTANALAFANGKKVVAVSSTEALARPFIGEERCCAAIIDAKNGNCYAALYRGGDCLTEANAFVTEDFLKGLPSCCILTGSGAADGAMPTAKNVALCACGREGADEVVPLYLRPSQAERLWKER